MEGRKRRRVFLADIPGGRYAGLLGTIRGEFALAEQLMTHAKVGHDVYVPEECSAGNQNYALISELGILISEKALSKEIMV